MHWTKITFKNLKMKSSLTMWRMLRTVVMLLVSATITAVDGMCPSQCECLNRTVTCHGESSQSSIYQFKCYEGFGHSPFIQWWQDIQYYFSCLIYDLCTNLYSWSLFSLFHENCCYNLKNIFNKGRLKKKSVTFFTLGGSGPVLVTLFFFKNMV